MKMASFALTVAVFVCAGATHATPYPALYPKPANVSIGSGSSLQLAKNLSIRVNNRDCSGTCSAIVELYRKILSAKALANPLSSATACPTATSIRTVEITVSGPIDETPPAPLTDESYTVDVLPPPSGPHGTPGIFITAQTLYGARHALETLSQLFVPDPADTALTAACGHSGWLLSSPVHVSDAPVYSYRGLMIDTGRHYMTPSRIRSVLDGMAMLKLNVLHWHVVDAESFPVKTIKYPQLAAHAFAPSAVYTLEDIRSLVDYARSRGVRIVVEFDMPGHGSWGYGMPSLNLSSCPDVFDVTRPELYAFLTDFLTEIAGSIDDPYLFLGGDEVGFKGGYHCYEQDPSVAAWMKQHGLNASQMNDYFWAKVASEVMPALPGNHTLGLWVADLPNPAGSVWPPPDISKLSNKTTFLNVYQSMSTAKATLAAGFPTVVSVAGSDWYLDYHPTFTDVWKVRPRQETDCASHPGWSELLLGGEVCMWGTGTDGKPRTLDTDLFAGGLAAVAERLWADPYFDPAGVEQAAAAAQARYESLQCHWSIHGAPTFSRKTKGDLSVTPIYDGGQMQCPSDFMD